MKTWQTVVLALAVWSGLTLAAEDAREGVAAALDAFHLAASNADEERYLGAFAPEGVFLGTAPGERWTVEEFRAFVRPYFSRGRGWSYRPRAGARHVQVSADGLFAWFDEVLDNDKYGECRGSGVLRRIGGQWRIVQYELVIPIPNEIAGEVVERIRQREN